MCLEERSVHVGRSRFAGPLGPTIACSPVWPLMRDLIRTVCTASGLGTVIGEAATGQRSAIIYSLIVSCECRGKDPLAYLKDILTRLPRMTNQDDLSALNPANWQPA